MFFDIYNLQRYDYSTIKVKSLVSYFIPTQHYVGLRNWHHRSPPRPPIKNLIGKYQLEKITPPRANFKVNKTPPHLYLHGGFHC